MLTWLLTLEGQTTPSTITNAGTNPVFMIDMDGTKYVTILVQYFDDLPAESKQYYQNKYDQASASQGVARIIDVEEPDHIHPTNIEPS
jgi:hypothetical protein